MKQIRFEIDVTDENGRRLTATETCPPEEYDSAKERAFARLEAVGYKIEFIRLLRNADE